MERVAREYEAARRVGISLRGFLQSRLAGVATAPDIAVPRVLNPAQYVHWICEKDVERRYATAGVPLSG